MSARGREFEAVLDVQHKLYRVRRLADIEKIGNPIKALESPRSRTRTEQARFGKGGPVLLGHFTKAKHVDFSGVLKGGRAVRLEAKQGRGTSVRLDRVEPHQVASLKRCDLYGGVAAVLICLPAGMWYVPWQNWRPSGEKKSLNAVDLDARGERFAIETGAQLALAGNPTAADWLEAAQRRGWV